MNKDGDGRPETGDRIWQSVQFPFSRLRFPLVQLMAMPLKRFGTK